MIIEELIDIVMKRYIEEDILRLDVSDATKNKLKRDLRKQFKDEDFLYDIKNSVDLISKDKIREKQKELEEEVKQMEKADIGVGFTLGEEWCNKKATIQAYKELLEEE